MSVMVGRMSGDRVVSGFQTFRRAEHQRGNKGPTRLPGLAPSRRGSPASGPAVAAFKRHRRRRMVPRFIPAHRTVCRGFLDVVGAGRRGVRRHGGDERWRQGRRVRLSGPGGCGLQPGPGRLRFGATRTGQGRGRGFWCRFLPHQPAQGGLQVELRRRFGRPRRRWTGPGRGGRPLPLASVGQPIGDCGDQEEHHDHPWAVERTRCQQGRHERG